METRFVYISIDMVSFVKEWNRLKDRALFVCNFVLLIVSYASLAYWAAVEVRTPFRVFIFLPFGEIIFIFAARIDIDINALGEGMEGLFVTTLTFFLLFSF